MTTPTVIAALIEAANEIERLGGDPSRFHKLAWDARANEPRKEWGRRLLAAAKEEAVDRGARKAYDDHYHKVRADIGYDDWLMVWRKAIAWWSEPIKQPTSNPALDSFITDFEQVHGKGEA